MTHTTHTTGHALNCTIDGLCPTEWGMSNLVQVNNDNKVFPYGVEWVYIDQGVLQSEYLGFSTPQEAREFIEQNKSYNFIKNK